METTKKERKHIGNNKVRCIVSTSFTGWQEEVQKAKKANKPEAEYAEFMPITHTVTVDFNNVKLTDLQVKACKGGIVDLQNAWKRSFKTGEAFRSYLENDAADVVVHFNDLGTQPKSREQIIEVAAQLSDEELEAILAERAAKKLEAEEATNAS